MIYNSNNIHNKIFSWYHSTQDYKEGLEILKLFYKNRILLKRLERLGPTVFNKAILEEKLKSYLPYLLDQEILKKYNNNYKKGISVLITAYNAVEYIEECIDSVANQTYFKHSNNYEILIGIDGCHDTLLKVKSIKDKYKNLKVLMMKKNKGTYITTNTLIKEAKYDNMLRFDSDDIMLPYMIEVFTSLDSLCMRTMYYDLINGDIKQSNHIAGGVLYFNKKIIKKIGGFRPWICASDGDFIIRCNRIYPIKAIKERLFLRRIHKNSLTRKDETKANSVIRTLYHQKIKKSRENKTIKIKSVINEFYYV